MFIVLLWIEQKIKIKENEYDKNDNYNDDDDDDDKTKTKMKIKWRCNYLPIYLSIDCWYLWWSDRIVCVCVCVKVNEWFEWKQYAMNKVATTKK